MEKNIVLIGFMGTGKTAVGTRLAQRLNREFVDTDKEIEKVTGRSVGEIFRKLGEVRFRSEEALVVNRLVNRRNLVIATGGGVVLNPDNLTKLKQSGILVCLTAEPEDIYQRVRRKRQNRPLLPKNFTVEDVKRMLEEREPYYAQADITISTTGLEPDAIADLILAKLEGLNNAQG